MTAKKAILDVARWCNTSAVFAIMDTDIKLSIGESQFLTPTTSNPEADEETVSLFALQQLATTGVAYYMNNKNKLKPKEDDNDNRDKGR